MKASRGLILVLGAAFPVPVLGILGVGDVVYDPANVAQTVNLLHQAQQEFDRLGSLLGVSTQQFDQLVRLATAVGNGGESAAFGLPPSSGQIQEMVRANPGQENISLSTLYNPNNQLDAFMGVPLSQWVQAVGNPQAFYRSVLINPALSRIGATEGLASPAISYLQWYATLSPEDQLNLAPRAANDVSNLMNGDWLQAGEQRRLNLQGLAAANQLSQAKAGQTQTLADQAQVQAQFQANANAILLETAAQAGEAHEAMVRTLGAQGQAMQEENLERRDADEIRLNLSP